MAGTWKWYALGAAAVAGLSFAISFQVEPLPPNPILAALHPPSNWRPDSFFVLKVASACAAPMSDPVQTQPRHVPIAPVESCSDAFDLAALGERANQAVVR